MEEKKSYWIRRENITDINELILRLNMKGYVENSKYFSKDNWGVLMTTLPHPLPQYIMAPYEEAAWKFDPKYSWLAYRKEVKTQEEFLKLI